MNAQKNPVNRIFTGFSKNTIERETGLEVDGASQTRINTERRARYQPGVFKVYSTHPHFYVNQHAC